MKKLFLIGFPKCGTTSLAAYLRQHPSVAVSQPKEPMYYMPGYKGCARITASQYSRMFSVNEDTRYVCDATPDYIYFDEAIRQIISDTNDVNKFVVLFRNHVDMVQSLHAQEIKNGNEDIMDFEEAWKMSGRRRAGEEVPKTCKEAWRLDYQTRGRMGARLERFASMTPRDAVLFVDFNELANNSERMWDELTCFLDVENTVRIDFGKKNARRTIARPAMLRYAKTLLNIKHALGLRTSFGIAARVRRAGLGKEIVGNTVIDARFRAEIRDELGDDIELVRAYAAAGPAVLGPHWMQDE